jgi:hypothetical protein
VAFCATTFDPSLNTYCGNSSSLPWHVGEKRFGKTMIVELEGISALAVTCPNTKFLGAY